MVYFPFESDSLSALTGQDRDKAELAVRTARKLCAFYQFYARSLFEGHDTVKDVGFSLKEGALAGEIVKSKNSFGIPKSTEGKATLKLFYAGQIEFYKKNPQLTAVFGPNFSPLLLSMIYLNAVLPETYEPIDSFFSDTVRKIKISKSDNTPPRLLPPPGPS